MKKWTALLLAAVGMSLLLTGCGQKETPGETSGSQTVMYSNLADQESRDKLTELMDGAGIAKERQEVFFAHLDQFNEAVPAEMLTGGMEQYDPAKPKYDPYAMQDKWLERYPVYLGQNCRLTAYTLFGDQVKVDNKDLVREDFVLLDQDAMSTDPWEPENGEKSWWLEDFSKFYSSVPTEATKDVQVHLANIQKDWQERGITFADNDKVSLISVVIHDNLDGDNLFVGHAALLFEDGDQLWLLEKLAFQEPYQLVRFGNRDQLNEYLMTKYDLDQDQPMAAPFIMENDQMMEGYRQLPKQ